jgi:heme a synthase
MVASVVRTQYQNGQQTQSWTGFVTSLTAERAAENDRLRPVRIWLYILSAFILLMVLVGGATRLTESGLSITSWKPLSGIIPPLTAEDWDAEFQAYRQIPQYQQEFAGWMGVEEFKLIFWWEWLHRFLGRVLGFMFAIPFVIFLIQKRIPKSLVMPLGGLFVLGGFQGVLGWWMVSSGLTELTSVSQYRLAAHLSAACVLLMAMIWVVRRLEPPTRGVVPSRGWILANWGLVALLFLQIVAGAFVAGLNAGMIHNTWPMMNGGFIPGGLGVIDPFWRNLFENVTTVQFNHRMIAYAIVAYVAVMWWQGRNKPGYAGVHGWFPRIGVITGLQVVLGIATLLTVVNIPLALGHQALAFMLIAMVVAYLADITRISSR